MDAIRNFFADWDAEKQLDDPRKILLNWVVAEPPTEERRGFARLSRRCEPPPAALAPKLSLSDTRKTILGAALGYLSDPNPDYALIIRGAAGIGKTWIGVEVADWVATNMGKRVLYAGARKDFFVDIVESVKGQGLRIGNWYKWTPRQGDIHKNGNAQAKTCIHADAMAIALNRGYDSLEICKVACGWAYMNDSCTYRAQARQKAPIIYGNHNHVVGGHPNMDQFYCIIGDENPMGSFLRKLDIPTNRLMIPEYDQDCAEVLVALNNLCITMKGSEARDVLSGTKLLVALGGAQFVFDKTETYQQPGIAFTNFDPRKLDEVAKMQYNVLPHLIPTLHREAKAALVGEAYNQRLFVDRHGLQILSRDYVHPKAPDHIIWFDATGTTELYEALLQRPIRMIDVAVEQAGRVHQVEGRSYGRSSLVEKKAKGAPESGGDSFTHHVAELSTHVSELTRGAKNPAVISYKGLGDKIAPNLPYLHFGANRGSNALEQSDVLVVAGLPMPNLNDVVSATKCLYPEIMTPFDDRWIAKWTRFNYVDPGAGSADGAPMDKAGVEREASFFADARLNAILWQMREAELIQAVNRTRLIHRDTDVYLLTNHPIPELPIATLTTTYESMRSPKGVSAYKWPGIVAAAEQIAAEQGYVTAKRLCEKMGVTLKPAREYVRLIAELDGWSAINVQVDGAKMPTLAAFRRQE